MKAAVVSSYSEAPAYAEFAEPSARPGEVLVTVKAAALSRLVQAQAAGKHYSSAKEFPFVPGVDGVGLLEDGTRVYFAFPKAPFGSMAERTAVQRSMCVPLPEGMDAVTAAAAANPGMSSWAALKDRARLVAGETVLINGATGVAGRMAIQIAKHLGASRVVATGRNAASVAGLPALGADAVILLDQPPDRLKEAFRGVVQEGGANVVLDYLWGPSAETLLAALVGHGSGEAEPPVRFVQIGSVAGPSITMPADVLRSSGVTMLGSGLGSVSNERLVADIGELMQAFVPAGLSVDARAVPLVEVGTAWGGKGSERVVFTM